jgi:hypothetical protein
VKTIETGEFGLVTVESANDVATMDATTIAMSPTAFTGGSKTKGTGITAEAMTAIKEGSKYATSMWVSVK